MVTLLLLSVIHISAVIINILLDSLHKCHVRTFIRNLLLCVSNRHFSIVLMYHHVEKLGYVVQNAHKTIYLANISDRLVTKVNGLQSAPRNVDITFRHWQTQLTKFSNHENCHFNNFMEFISKFSLEITRAFSSLLRFTEINDILHPSNLFEIFLNGVRNVLLCVHAHRL